jgi:tetratricopeptide (TPR) repeat protein
MTRIAVAALVSVLLAAGRASAAPDPPASPPPPPTAEAAAAAVVRAWREKDEARVRTLAARDDPDPWAVADALLVSGAREAAEAFAKASPRKDVEGLPAFVAGWTAGGEDLAAREALAKGNAALVGKRPAEALEAFAAAPAAAMAYLRLRCAFGVAVSLRELGRHAEAADRFRAVAGECEAIGWPSRAATALLECIRAEQRADRVPSALETVGRLLSLQEARGDRLGIANAHGTAAWFHGEAGRWDDAHAAHTRALAIFRELGDRARTAATLNDIAWASRGRRRLTDLENALKASLAVSEPAGLWEEAARSHELFATTLADVGKLDGAVEHGRAALAHAQKAGDALRAARLSFLVGRWLGDLGAHEEALGPLGASVTGYEALGTGRAPAAHAVRARWAWSLAALGRLDEARPHVARVRVFAETSSSPLMRGVARRAEARLLRAEGGFAEAVRAYREAAAALEASQQATDALLVLVEVADALREAKDPAEARAAADLAVEGARKRRDPLALPFALAAAAGARRDSGETKEALALAREAVEAHERAGHARGRDAARALVAELEAAAGPR